MKRLIERLSDLQIRRPFVPLAIVAAVTVVFAFFASKLELRTRYEALLPDSQPSVKELHRVEARTSGAQTVLVVLEGPDGSVLRAFGDAIVTAFRTLPKDVVASAEDGVHEGRAFLAPRAGLFLESSELDKLANDVDARWDWEVARQTGALLDDDDDEKPAPIDTKAFEKRFDLGRYPDGYYQRRDGTALVVVARSPIAGGDLGKIGPALDRMHEVVDGVRASRPDFAAVRVGWAGDMPTGFIEYGLVKDDLLSVGAIGIGLVLAVVLLYFVRIRAVVVMGITIAVGLVWTFGLTQIVIGHLNIATGFLVSIVAGNGINVGILYQARYFEERRNGATSEMALRTAVRSTWLPTIIAAVAAAASYGSLLVTDFRAFRHFGFIAATGMLLCWVVKTMMVPPLLLLVDRQKSVDARGDGFVERLRRRGLGYGKIFARIVPIAPRGILVAAILIGIVGTVVSVRWVRSDPMDYDLAHVQNDPSQTVELHRTWDVANAILGGSSGSMIVLADTPAEAKELHDLLRARWEAAPANAKPFVSATSVWSFVPSDQAAKIPALVRLSDRVRRSHERGFLSDDDWKRVEQLLAPDDLAPFGLDDLPVGLVSPFTEKDGTRGTIVLVEPESGASEDLHYLLRYSDAFRTTQLASGKIVRGSGRAVIFADILQAVVQDIPKAIALSLGMTLAAVLLAFRRGVQSLAVLATLFVAVAGIGCFLWFGRIQLTFLNFAALPITFGVGVDYAVNVAQRYHADGSTSILRAVETTGGAVILCSLTTTLGYVALIGSHNQAIRSLGTIAVVGELCCLLGAVLLLPAFWLVVERTRRVEQTS